MTGFCFVEDLSNDTRATPIIAIAIPAIFSKPNVSPKPIKIALIAILIFTATDVIATPFIWELLPIKTNREINKIPQIKAAYIQFVSVQAAFDQLSP